MPSSVWSHLAALSPKGQLPDEEESLLVRHYLGLYLLYALVGIATSHADVVGILRAQFETR